MTWEFPHIGMGATIYHYSDRTAATIVFVSTSAKTIFLQEDLATRIDCNGISESQEYIYKPDNDGAFYKATLRKDGKYRIAKSKRLVSLGVRDKYHDYSF